MAATTRQTSPATCDYCGNYYTSGGGLTRHLQRCPVRLARHEVDLAAAQAPVIVAQTNVTQTNVTSTMVIQYTQQVVAAEVPLFDDFLAKLLTVVGEQAPAWRGGADTALEKIREIKGAVAESPNPSYKQIGTWLASRDVERDIAEGVDDEAIMRHTSDQVNRIEETVLALIKTYIPEAEKARLDAAFEQAGSLFAL
jgi:hypothetical protein